MRDQGILSLLIIGTIALILFVFNFPGSEQAVPFNRIFPDDTQQEVRPPAPKSFIVPRCPEPRRNWFPKISFPNFLKPSAQVSSVKKENVVPEKLNVPTPKSEIPAKVSIVVPVSDLTKGERENKNFAIQVVSYKNQEQAQEVLKSIQTQGHPAYIISRDLGASGIRYRIYVGRFVTREEAENYLPKMTELYRDSFVVQLTP